MAFGVGIGAVNTGNNLLYLLLAAMLAIIVLSGIIAEMSLKHLVVTRHVPPRIFAGEETAIRVEVRNDKSVLPSFSLIVREFFGKKRTLDPVRFPHVAPEGKASGEYRCVFPRRGRCRFKNWQVETEFPFGLFGKGKLVDADDVAIVFPRADLDVPLPGLGGPDMGAGLNRPGPGDEAYALRVYRVGDDKRHIAWKASARRRELIVAETREGGATEVALLFANAAVSKKRTLSFEIAVDYVASLATKLVQEGYKVSLTTFDEHIPASTEYAQLDRIYAALALVRQHTPAKLSDPESASKKTNAKHAPNQEVITDLMAYVGRGVAAIAVATEFAQKWVPTDADETIVINPELVAKYRIIDTEHTEFPADFAD